MKENNNFIKLSLLNRWKRVVLILYLKTKMIVIRNSGEKEKLMLYCIVKYHTYFGTERILNFFLLGSHSLLTKHSHPIRMHIIIIIYQWIKLHSKIIKSCLVYNKIFYAENLYKLNSSFCYFKETPISF